MYAHLINRTEHSEECDERCANDCRTQGFLDWLEEPLMPWEIEEDARIRQRRRALERGEISA